MRLSRTKPPSPDLERARALARLLDSAFRVPGTGWRFGLDPILGLIPGLGDVAGGVLSGWILWIAGRLGAPLSVLARMGLNLVLDTLAGWVPLLGDLFDAGYKANLRNLDLLERWLAEPAALRRSSATMMASILIAALLLLGSGLALSVWALVTILRAMTGG